MPRRLRIGYARAVRMSGDGTTYVATGQAAGVLAQRKVVSAQGSYAVTGQDVVFSTNNTGEPGGVIPANRLIDWTAAGVPGGIPFRSTIAATISTGGNDSTDATSTIQNAIDAAASGSVVYLTPGIYRCGSLAMKSGVTLRGAGEWCKSTTSVAVGTGTKAFTVPANLGYASGVAVRVWINGDRGYFMQGTVTSYSNTTLTLNITASQGSGTYSDWRVGLTTIKSVAGASTGGLITFGTSGVSSPTVGTNKVVSSGATSGSTSIVTTSTGPTVTVGQYLVISETNNSEVALWGASNVAPGATWVDGWNTLGTRARGQIVEVTGVTGTTTQTLTFTPALFTDYPNTCWATPFSASVNGAGLESLQLFGDSTDSHSALVYMQRAVKSWVKAVDFDFPSQDGFYLAWCFKNDIDSCHIYDCFSVNSNARFNRIVHKTTLSRVVNSIVERSIDSIMLEWGAAGNVVAYNYILHGYNPSVRNFLVKGITTNHGAHPQFNLIEGNVVTHKIVADSTWGSSSDSVIFRNAVFGFDQTRGPNNTRTIDATTYNPIQVNYAIDLWEGQIRYSVVGNVIGNTGNWAARPKVRKPTYPTSFDYDTTVLCIALGKDSDGLGFTPILTSPLATCIDEGNYDVVTVGQYWSAGAQTLPDSYAYSARPSWWDDNVTWPPINPVSPGTLANATNPARLRYDQGISAAGRAVSSVGDFEVQSSGTTITRAIAATVFKGLQAGNWTTTAGNADYTPVEVSTMTILSAASHNPGQTLLANGTPISTTSALGMRVVQSANANLFLQYQTAVNPQMGFFFRWDGAQINSSPRDVAGWNSNQGFYQYLQIYDGAAPYFHTHYQGVGFVGGSGSNVSFSKSHWYWVEMAWVDAGATFSISFYDAESGYSLVGTSTNTMPSGTQNKPDKLLIGCIKYASGGSQTFDFDNIILSFDGAPIPRPTT